MILQPIVPVWVIASILSLALGVWVFAYVRRNKKTRSIIWWLRVGMLIILALMALRPCLPGTQSVAGATNVDVFFVVDNTYSMRAEDYDGAKTRMQGVQNDIEAIAQRFAGARFSLIAYDNTAYRVLPLVSDSAAVITEASAMVPPYSFDGTGSQASTPVELLTTELSGAKNDSETRSRAVFFFSDGEDTTDDAAESYVAVQPYIDGGAVFGYGTEDGGKMRTDATYLPDDSDTQEYITYLPEDGLQIIDAISKIDEDNLRSIAAQLDVPYLHRVSPDDTEDVFRQIQADRIIEKGHDVESYQDIYWLVAPLLSLYFVAELAIIGSIVLQARASSGGKR